MPVMDAMHEVSDSTAYECVDNVFEEGSVSVHFPKVIRDSRLYVLHLVFRYEYNIDTRHGHVASSRVNDEDDNGQCRHDARVSAVLAHTCLLSHSLP